MKKIADKYLKSNVLDKNSKDKIVQFEFVNTTSNTKTIDLFDSNTLDTTPVIDNTQAPTSLSGSYVSGASGRGIQYVPTNGYIYESDWITSNAFD